MTLQNFGKKDDQDLRQVENSGCKTKSKELYGVFNKTMLKTLKSCAEELNINLKWTRTNSNSSSNQSNGQNQMKGSDYEDDQNWKRNNKVVSNGKKQDPNQNGAMNGWRQNNSYSSSMTFNQQRRNDKKNLVFDKRDFLFPYTTKAIREQIQLDEVAQYSVTDTRTADEISDFIAQLDGLNRSNITITDGTACVGGNTISFCKKFKKVQAVELDQTRYNMLQHNLKLLEYTNVICYNADYRNLLSSLRQDVVFLDPPWGGPSYKEQDKVELFLGDVSLDKICDSLKGKTKYIIIKAPPNLNYEKFSANITGNLQVFHQFRKMLLIAVDYYHPLKVVQQEQTTDDSYKNNNKTNGKKSQSTIKETIKYHNIDTKSQNTVDTSNYDKIAIEAADYAAACYGDYVNNGYVYRQAFLAAREAARNGAETVRNAAIAAYQRATADVQYASQYDDSHVADAFLSVASNHDYYVDDIVGDADDVDSTDELDGSNGISHTNNVDVSNVNSNTSIDDTNGIDSIINSDVAAACKAPLDDEDF